MNHVQFTRSCIIWIHSVVSAPPLLRETNGEKSRLGLKTARHGARAAVLLGKLPRELPKIRPHRFGGEGVLIGGQNSNTKCSMTFVNIAVAISALAGGGGPKNDFAPRPEYGGVFDIFRGFLGV